MITQGYGAIHADSEEAGVKQVQDWQSRGTILGLIIDIGSAYGYLVALLTPLFFGVSSVSDQFVACETAAGTTSVIALSMCEYTKGYLLAFPALGSVVMLLLIGRDLIQKRLYYGMLSSGGVIDYGGNVPWKDPIMIALYVSFAHCLVFFLWTTPILLQLIRLGTTALENTDAKTIRDAFESITMVMAALIPITLIVVCLHIAYNLQKTLVPLSEYVHDSDQAIRSLPTLRVMNDSVVKLLVDDITGSTAMAQGQLSKAYSALIGAYQERMVDARSSRATQVSSIGLVRSLWPSRLLMRPELAGSSEAHFQRFWNVVALTSVAWLIYQLFFMYSLMVEQVRDAFGEHPSKSLRLAVYIGHFLVLGLGISSFVDSVRPAGSGAAHLP